MLYSRFQTRRLWHSLSFLPLLYVLLSLFYTSPFNTTNSDVKQSIATLVLFIALALFIVPLHYYDILALVAVFMLIVAVPIEGRWITRFWIAALLSA